MSISFFLRKKPEQPFERFKHDFVFVSPKYYAKCSLALIKVKNFFWKKSVYLKVIDAFEISSLISPLNRYISLNTGSNRAKFFYGIYKVCQL